jgi:membrane dipeptidase
MRKSEGRVTSAQLDDRAELRIDRLVEHALFINGNDCTVAVPNAQGWSVHFDDGHHTNLVVGRTHAVVSLLSSELRENFRGGMSKIAALFAQFERYPDCFQLVLEVEDIQRARDAQRVGVVMGFLNSTPIEDDLSSLRLFHHLGIRAMHLTYNRRNLVGDGVGEQRDGGLTRFGEKVVREMNRLGILIDLSHSGDTTALEAIAVSEKPVVYTHTACRRLNDHIRNVTDEQLTALAEKGGLVGISSGKFLRSDIAEVGSTVDDYLDHVDHVIDVAGDDHVAIGLDVAEGQTREEWMTLDEHYPELFGGATGAFERVFSTEGLWDFGEQKRTLVTGMVNRGYSEERIEKILGLNWLRVLDQVWS